MTEEQMRKTGVAHGMVHALAMIKTEIGHRTYHPIDRRYTRRIAAREAEVKPLRDIYGRLESDLRRLQASIDP